MWDIEVVGPARKAGPFGHLSGRSEQHCKLLLLFVYFPPGPMTAPVLAFNKPQVRKRILLKGVFAAVILPKGLRNVVVDEAVR